MTKNSSVITHKPNYIINSLLNLIYIGKPTQGESSRMPKSDRILVKLTLKIKRFNINYT